MTELARRQLMRYAVVGLLTNAAGYSVYLLLTMVLGMAPKLSMSCLYAVGATLGFFGHGRATFSYRGQAFAAGWRYILVQGLGYALNFLLLFVLVDRFGFAHQVVQAVAIVVVATFLFLAFKFFVFPGKPLP